MLRRLRHLQCLILMMISFGIWAEPNNSIHDDKVNIGVQTITFFDSERETPIITEIFYPADPKVKAFIPRDVWKREPEARDAEFSKLKRKYPLILFSHGSLGSRLDSVWFMYALVKAGYMVASVDHYGDTWNLTLPKITLQPWLRAKDISFALRALLNHPAFKDHINPEAIGFAGLSQGGLTGIWLAGGEANIYPKPTLDNKAMIDPNLPIDEAMIDGIHYSVGRKNYNDPLIKAFFLMAPDYGFVFDAKGLSKIEKPIYLISGDEDKVVPIQLNILHFAKYINRHQLTILPKAGHFVFLNEPTERGGAVLLPELITDHPSVNRHKVHKQIEQEAVHFFNKQLRKESS